MFTDVDRAGTEIFGVFLVQNIKATLMILLGFGGMLAMTYGAMIIRTNWDKKRYAPILNGNYEVLRTKIKFIDYHDIGTT